MLIGLTGGIGSGKSLVSAELRRLGARLIDADAIAREVVRPHEPAYNEIVAEFGEEALLADDSIDRKALGRIVFSNPERLRRLNEITHPRIREVIRQRAREAAAEGGQVIVVDAALLFETGLNREMDKVIVVCADKEIRLKRIAERDGFGHEEALRRMDSQMPLEEKVKRADFVIDNNGTVDETLSKVRELFVVLAASARDKKA